VLGYHFAIIVANIFLIVFSHLIADFNHIPLFFNLGINFTFSNSLCLHNSIVILDIHQLSVTLPNIVSVIHRV
jgi:hypothetical protein